MQVYNMLAYIMQVRHHPGMHHAGIHHPGMHHAGIHHADMHHARMSEPLGFSGIINKCVQYDSIAFFCAAN